MAPDEDQLIVTGLGMVSGLGLDVATSCAAARAGLSGAGQLSFTLINPLTNDPEPVIGHQVPLAVGFEGFGRLLRLAQLAVQDLRRTTDLHSLDPERCLIVAVLPPSERSFESVDAAPDKPYRNTQLKSPVSYPPATTMLKRFSSLIAAGVLPDHQLLVLGGHAAFVQALREVEQRLAQGSLTHAVVIAVDSLIESHTLQWLFDHVRLKFADNVVGLVPGEAAVAVLLERTSRARGRKAQQLATITGSAVAKDEHHLYGEKPPIGIGLATAIKSLAVQLKDGLTTSWVISDHNGEVQRATDWGYALNRLITSVEPLKQAYVDYPAITFGDTGAASGAVALCRVLRAFARKCAPAQDALVVSSSDRSERGAFCLSQVRSERL
jgi:3-oxoacyl-[acyl-carrier-protein] synthase-1